MKNIADYFKEKKHIDCDWLIKKGDDVYCCCDPRSNHRSRLLSREEIEQPACPLFHLSNEERHHFLPKTAKQFSNIKIKI